MVTASFINRLSEAVDKIETRTEPRPWKVVTVPRGYHEDPDAARERHYAVHPEDRGADVLIWHFFHDKGTTDEG
jgi:hypothetical protein